MSEVIVELENKIKDAQMSLTEEWRNDADLASWAERARLQGYITGLREALVLFKDIKDDQRRNI